MNKLLIFALVGTVLLGATVFLITHKKTSAVDVPITEEVISQWKLYKQKYQKRFSDPDLEVYRMEIFAKNLEVVKKDTTGTYGVTQFFDLSPEEFQSTYLGFKGTSTQGVHDLKDGASDINWVTQNKVSKVKNQGQCGSCWAFSTTGSLESALILAGKADTTIDLSEQQLVDCSTQNSGCNGGLMDYAFSYIKTAHITTEGNYPYTATGHSCNKGEIKAPLFGLSGFTDVTAKSTSALLAALQKQPVSIAVDATNWSYYTGGVFNNCQQNLNHGVLLVGFQNNAWLVKNSWGTTWGENGYIQLANGNTCGLANAASYPTGAN